MVWMGEILPFTLVFYKRHIPEELPAKPRREPRIPYDINIFRFL
jgi:hypothetical protein